MNPSRLRRLRPVPDTEPQLTFRTIHGHRRAFRMTGEGPTLLLLHGIGDNSTTWTEITPHLAENYTVIAPDLLGHGHSDKPRADYSVAAYANGIRDLLSTLGIDHATVIGHSLGGGIAMQFAYQFPHMVDRLILVSTGGITKDVHPLLRLAATPILNEALKLLRLPGAVPAMRWVGTMLTRLHGTPLHPGAALHDTPDLVRILTELPDPTAYEAYLRTLRAVVDWHGQAVTMLDRCYLTASLPIQLIWGDRDTVIPVSHAHTAHTSMPGSRLDTFPDAGHFPFRDDPLRFVHTIEKFLSETRPSPFDEARWRQLLNTGTVQPTLTPDASTRATALDTIGPPERKAT
ncbi:Hydrolase, alpha/beta fold family functionally coupled to Phosphoribulokinase [Rhodococcus wratislaviensis]|uniref:Hydrolase, alpha/beta fold family functionally coupled to Phosphoribulokinase n=1 Tax=Rhodococcus wratislaviensis TaxID=44752 RepID=A0A402CIZ6_RHOWR|nr:alpha/beta hydrolase [Rhodococcus wratislaviensis]GCE43583.1 Hydrolase, alpha/beta fold family functionally coupled to Phosphoribulokinase [Rhodococcus wratislaviensis]